MEDITSEDVSTNAVMRSAVKGTVDLIAKEDGIITFDANHEMAGKELNFKIELLSVE